MDEQIKIIEAMGGDMIILLSGEIDFGKAEAFYEEVMSAYHARPANVCFDCKELEFIDSTTLGTFVKIFKEMKADGFEMILANLQPKIKKLFVICALDSMIKIV